MAMMRTPRPATVVAFDSYRFAEASMRKKMSMAMLVM